MPIGIVAMGFSRTNYGPFTLPVTLSSIGMLGCDLWHSAEVIGLSVTQISPTSMSFSYPIPLTPSLANSHAYLQACAVAPYANPAWLITSNAIDWRIGAF